MSDNENDKLSGTKENYIRSLSKLTYAVTEHLHRIRASFSIHAAGDNTDDHGKMLAVLCTIIPSQHTEEYLTVMRKTHDDLMQRFTVH